MVLEYKSFDDPKLREAIIDGAVGVIPTDTVYGLVCVAANATSVQRLYQLKHRESKPGTIIASNIDQLVDLGIKRRYLKAVERYWPNSISVIVPAPELEHLHLGKNTLAVRVPNNEQLSNLLTSTGPLLTTSANLPGDPEATTIDEARRYFKDKVDFYVDGGSMANAKPSTIIKMVDDAVVVLRQGSVEIVPFGEVVQN